MKLGRRVAIGTGAALALAAGGTGVAVALSNGADDGAGKPVPAAAAAQAKAAALKVTGGGTVTALEIDGEHGATYEVEVTTPTGRSVDVRLDGAFALVGQPEPNGDGAERGNANEHGDQAGASDPADQPGGAEHGEQAD
ncbi:MAG TPA: PepSY domain-containing protein [Conexibacter sp.]|nr:PepSY domain-containing protein [Conexibacter sp.]